MKHTQKMKNIVIGAIALMMITQCGSDNNDTATSQENKAEESAVQGATLYSLQQGSLEVKWTAFKLTEKIGVNGKFEQFELITQTNEATTLTQLMEGVSISINTDFMSTGDTERDGKIKAQFFGTMANKTNQISATITNIDGEYEGTLTMPITMNGVVFDQTFIWKYTDNNVVIMTATIDINNWQAQKSLAALNTVCNDLHKGQDGKSVLWPDVEVVVNFRVVETFVSL